VSILRSLLLVLALLVPPMSTTLAHMDPPDPTWASGYWDDDDFDYAVDAVLSVVAVMTESPTELDGPRLVAVGRVDALDVDASAAPVLTTDDPRAPPTRAFTLA
jgi:hypothetical protein